MIGIMVCSITIINLLSLDPFLHYIDHYTRFDNLSWSLRRLIDFCLLFKNGVYFVLLALMFNQYHRYKFLIFIIVPIVCAYEIFFIHLGRVLSLSQFFWHFLDFTITRVTPINLKRGMVFLIALALVFSGIGIIRASNYSLEIIQDDVIKEKE